MKFIKKNIKSIIGMILGIILASGISVYATYRYFATEISYTKEGTEITVEQALNELYSDLKDKKYTEMEYQNYGQAQYDKAMLEHNYYTNNNFAIKTGTKYYELGFTPSIVFLDCGGSVYAWIVKGENVKNWANTSEDAEAKSGKDNDGTKIDGTGFYWSSNEDTIVKLYVVK